MNDTCAVHFVDVGQGACNIITFTDEKGTRRGIVIDCPKRSEIPLRILRRYVKYIDVLAFTHNDSDHAGGAANLLAAFEGRIGEIWHLKDRPWPNLHIVGLIEEQLAKNALTTRPYCLWTQPQNRPIYDHFGVALEVLAPDFYWVEKHTGQRNLCAVLLLTCAGHRILFTGDSTENLWDWLHTTNGMRPLECDIVTVPHHGGALTKSKSDKKRKASAERFFREYVRAGHAIASVGTSNRFKHPQHHVIHAARTLTTAEVVLCTQITGPCCGVKQDPELVIPGIIKPSLYSQSNYPTRTAGGSPADIGCAGSVSVVLRPGGIDWGNDGDDDHVAGFSDLTEHQHAVDGLVRRTFKAKPMCRFAPPSAAQRVSTSSP